MQHCKSALSYVRHVRKEFIRLLEGRAGGCGNPDPVFQRGNHGKQCEPSQKTAVHASFLFLMALPWHPIGRLGLEYNSHSFPSTNAVCV